MLDYCSRLHKPKLGSLLSRIKMLLHKSTSCPSDIYHSCLHLISPSGSSACFTWMQAIKLQRTTRVWKPPPARRRGRGTSTQCENSSCHVHAPIQRTLIPSISGGVVRIRNAKCTNISTISAVYDTTAHI